MESGQIDEEWKQMMTEKVLNEEDRRHIQTKCI